jgi:hypothetical protein
MEVKLSMKYRNLIGICMLVLLILFTASGCKDSPSAADESKALVWVEENMFGLKQPDGVITDHMQEFSGYSYVLADMTDDEVAATIQAIKDLGFTKNPDVTDISYLGYAEDNPYNSLYIIHYKNQFMDEVTISSFIGSLADGDRE